MDERTAPKQKKLYTYILMWLLFMDCRMYATHESTGCLSRIIVNGASRIIVNGASRIIVNGASSIIVNGASSIIVNGASSIIVNGGHASPDIGDARDRTRCNVSKPAVISVDNVTLLRFIAMIISAIALK